MARKLQIKRGLKKNLPTMAQGEFAMTTDSGAEELYIGNGVQNLQIPLLKDGKLPEDVMDVSVLTADEVKEICK